MTLKSWNFVPELMFCLLQLAKVALSVFEAFIDLFTGYKLTSGTKKERKDSQKYATSAQLVKIKFRCRFRLLDLPDTRNFLYLHERYLHPREVLKTKNTFLFNVTESQAIFGVISDPDVSIYHTRSYPFMFISQFILVDKLILMPLESFHHLADDLGDPCVPVSVLQMTARCGSTLLCQMLKRVQGVRVMAEPWTLVKVNHLHQEGKTSRKENQKLVQSVIRMQCKVDPDDEVSHIIWKMSGCNSVQTNIIAQLFPEIKQFFVTRHPKNCMRSLIKLVGVETDRFYTKFLQGHRFFLNLYPFSYDHDGKLPKKLKVYKEKIFRKEDFTGELGALHYILIMYEYFRTKHHFVATITYEDLTENTRGELERIFDILDLPKLFLKDAQQELRYDSQNGALCQRGSQPDLEKEENVEKIDALLKLFELPMHWDMSLDEFKHLLK